MVHTALLSSQCSANSVCACDRSHPPFLGRITHSHLLCIRLCCCPRSPATWLASAPSIATTQNFHPFGNQRKWLDWPLRPKPFSPLNYPHKSISEHRSSLPITCWHVPPNGESPPPCRHRQPKPPPPSSAPETVSESRHREWPRRKTSCIS